MCAKDDMTCSGITGPKRDLYLEVDRVAAKRFPSSKPGDVLSYLCYDIFYSIIYVKKVPGCLQFCLCICRFGLTGPVHFIAPSSRQTSRTSSTTFNEDAAAIVRDMSVEAIFHQSSTLSPTDSCPLKPTSSDSFLSDIDIFGDESIDNLLKD